jgi:hypothetical protein
VSNMGTLPWLEISDDPISEHAIRALFPHAKGYRFFPDSYERGVGFPTRISQRIRVYVLSGNCSYSIGDEKLTINASEYIDLEAGEYWFEVSGVSGVRLVSVFRLPEKYWDSLN